MVKHSAVRALITATIFMLFLLVQFNDIKMSVRLVGKAMLVFFVFIIINSYKVINVGI